LAQILTFLVSITITSPTHLTSFASITFVGHLRTVLYFVYCTQKLTMTKTTGLDHSKRFCKACNLLVARGYYWDCHVAGDRHQANLNRHRMCTYVRSPSRLPGGKRTATKTVTPTRPPLLLRKGVFNYGKHTSVTWTYGTTDKEIKMLCAQIAGSDKVIFLQEPGELEEDPMEDLDEFMDDDTEEMAPEGNDLGAGEPAQATVPSQGPDTQIRCGFAEYVSHASANYVNIS